LKYKLFLVENALRFHPGCNTKPFSYKKMPDYTFIYKRLLLCFLVFLVLVLSTTSCGGTGSGSSNNHDINNDPWRSITNNGTITSGIDVSGSLGMLSVINNSDSTIELPSLSVYDSAAGSAVAVVVEGATSVPAGATANGSFSFPGGATPDDYTLIMLYFGNDQAAVFVTASTYGNLSPAILHPETYSEATTSLSNYINPHSGTWNFQMDMSASHLVGTNCPSSPLSFVTSGETSFYVSNNGYSASWNVDDNIIAFNRSISNDSFLSQTYYFEVEGEETTTYGHNSWTLTPDSSTSMTGTLDWDNNLGCTAGYPITMEYYSSSAPVIYTLCEGAWTVMYSTLVCGSSIITNPASIPNLPLSGALNVVYDSLGSPVLLTFNNISSYQSLINAGGSNTYGTGFPNMDLGVITDPLLGPIELIGGFQMTASSSNSLFGTVTLTGYYDATTCSGGGSFLMSGPGC
jgi:hypothetical protein